MYMHINVYVGILALFDNLVDVKLLYIDECLNVWNF